MPFSFQPDIVQQVNQANGVPTTGPTPTLANRLAENGMSLLQKALMVVAGATVLVALGMFGYKMYLEEQIVTKNAKIQEYDAKLGKLDLEEMRKVSGRIKIVSELVKSHPSVNAALAILESTVEFPITYTGFDLRYNDVEKNYLLQLKGVAPNYKTIVQQVDTYKRDPFNKYIASLNVENVALDDSGRIGFTLKMPIRIAGVLPDQLVLVETATSSTSGTASSPTILQATSSTPGVASSTVATSTRPVSAGTTTSQR